MDKSFFAYWFKGFEESLKRMNEEHRNMVFEQCGKTCSESYTKRIYTDEYARSESLEDFLSRLKKRLPEIGFEIIEKDKVIELTYRYCACELVTSGFVSAPPLCECSRQSLLYNWESVLGEGRVRVEILNSVLRGSDCCKFRIYILRPTGE